MDAAGDEDDIPFAQLAKLQAQRKSQSQSPTGTATQPQPNASAGGSQPSGQASERAQRAARRSSTAGTAQAPVNTGPTPPAEAGEGDANKSLTKQDISDAEEGPPVRGRGKARGRGRGGRGRGSRRGRYSSDGSEEAPLQAPAGDSQAVSERATRANTRAAGSKRGARDAPDGVEEEGRVEGPEQHASAAGDNKDSNAEVGQRRASLRSRSKPQVTQTDHAAGGRGRTPRGGSGKRQPSEDRSLLAERSAAADSQQGPEAGNAAGAPGSIPPSPDGDAGAVAADTSGAQQTPAAHAAPPGAESHALLSKPGAEPAAGCTDAGAQEGDPQQGTDVGGLMHTSGPSALVAPQGISSMQAAGIADEPAHGDSPLQKPSPRRPLAAAHSAPAPASTPAPGSTAGAGAEPPAACTAAAPQQVSTTPPITTFSSLPLLFPASSASATPVQQPRTTTMMGNLTTAPTVTRLGMMGSAGRAALPPKPPPTPHTPVPPHNTPSAPVSIPATAAAKPDAESADKAQQQAGEDGWRRSSTGYGTAGDRSSAGPPSPSAADLSMGRHTSLGGVTQKSEGSEGRVTQRGGSVSHASSGMIPRSSSVPQISSLIRAGSSSELGLLGGAGAEPLDKQGQSPPPSPWQSPFLTHVNVDTELEPAWYEAVRQGGTAAAVQLSTEGLVSEDGMLSRDVNTGPAVSSAMAAALAAAHQEAVTSLTELCLGAACATEGLAWEALRHQVPAPSTANMPACNGDVGSDAQVANGVLGTHQPSPSEPGLSTGGAGLPSTTSTTAGHSQMPRPQLMEMLSILLQPAKSLESIMTAGAVGAGADVNQGSQHNNIIRRGSSPGLNSSAANRGTSGGGSARGESPAHTRAVGAGAGPQQHQPGDPTALSVPVHPALQSSDLHELSVGHLLALTHATTAAWHGAALVSAHHLPAVDLLPRSPSSEQQGKATNQKQKHQQGPDPTARVPAPGSQAVPRAAPSHSADASQQQAPTSSAVAGASTGSGRAPLFAISAGGKPAGQGRKREDDSKDREKDRDRDVDKSRGGRRDASLERGSRPRHDDRERERERERGKDHARDTDRQRKRDTSRDRGKDRDRGREDQRESERDRDKDKDRDRERERQRGTSRERGRDRDKELDKARERSRERDRDRKRSRSRSRGGGRDHSRRQQHDDRASSKQEARQDPAASARKRGRDEDEEDRDRARDSKHRKQAEGQGREATTATERQAPQKPSPEVPRAARKDHRSTPGIPGRDNTHPAGPASMHHTQPESSGPTPAPPTNSQAPPEPAAVPEPSTAPLPAAPRLKSAPATADLLQEQFPLGAVVLAYTHTNMHSIMRKGRLPALSRDSLEQLLWVRPEQQQQQHVELVEPEKDVQAGVQGHKAATAPLVLMWNSDKQILHGMYCARPGSAVERLAADEWPLSNASSSAHSSRSSEDKATPTHFLYMVKFDEVCYLPGCPVEYLPRWLKVSSSGEQGLSNSDTATSPGTRSVVCLPPALDRYGGRSDDDSRKRGQKESSQQPMLPGTAIRLTPQQVWEVWTAIEAHAQKKQREQEEEDRAKERRRAERERERERSREREGHRGSHRQQHEHSDHHTAARRSEGRREEGDDGRSEAQAPEGRGTPTGRS